jgi:hypothetical protein
MVSGEAGNFRVTERPAGLGPKHLGNECLCVCLCVFDYVLKQILLGKHA